MRKLWIALGIIGLAATIGAVEYWRFPDRAQPLKGSINETWAPGADGMNLIPVSQVSGKNFELANLGSVSLIRTLPVAHLFGIIRLNTETDQLRVLRSDYALASETTPFVSIYELFPLTDTTILKAFSLLQEKLRASAGTESQNAINQTDEFGIHSFYFNPSEPSDKAFLVAVTSERLIAFEYRKADHEKLRPFFSGLVPAKNPPVSG